MIKYMEIHAELLRRISSGAWAIGELIPNEIVLAEEFSCTRPTVSRALGMLVDAGLIERKKRVGSRVVQRATRAAVFKIAIVRNEITARGSSYAYLLLERKIMPPPAHVRAAFGDQDALYVRALHFENNMPYQLEDRWLNLAIVPQASGQDFQTQSPNEWLLNAIPYSRAEHVLRAAKASPKQAENLQLAVGEPVFIIERKTWQEEKPVTIVTLLHPAHKFRIVTQDVGM